VKVPAPKPRLRCAIYTRVSTDQRLEQEFNSLDAQREASEAYIKSQTHEGWALVRSGYDDGGYSGGSMERPALQRLLADVDARRIDVVVVYTRHERQSTGSLLLGKLFDEGGALMTPSWSRKGPKRYRYYVSQTILAGEKSRPGSIGRVSAPEIEDRVIEAIDRLANKGDAKGGGCTPSTNTENGGSSLPHRSGVAADTVAPDQQERIRSAIDRVSVERTAIRIILSGDFELSGGPEAQVVTLPWTPPSPYRRREIIQGASVSTSARPLRQTARLAFIEALRKAHSWLDELLANSQLTIEAIASREAKSERSIRMTLSIAFLAPDIVKAAIEGRLPRGFGLVVSLSRRRRDALLFRQIRRSRSCNVE
jgi:site-specific DNA recombinase